MRIFEKSHLIDSGNWEVHSELPTGYLVRRTIFEYGDFEIAKVSINLDGYQHEGTIWFGTPPILGMLNGATILHNNWGLIDYRLFAPDFCCDELLGLKAENLSQAALRFRIGELRQAGILKCYHEVSRSS